MILYVASRSSRLASHDRVRSFSTIHSPFFDAVTTELLRPITTIHTHQDPYTLAYHMYYLLSLFVLQCHYNRGVSIVNGLV